MKGSVARRPESGLRPLAAELERIGLEKMSVEEELNQSVDYTPIQRMRHSAAHVMAEAVQELFPGARFAIGPAIEDGFYYDMELPRALTPDDLPAIEDRMRASIAADHPFLHSRWLREEALQYFRQHEQPYKIEIIENLPDDEVSITRRARSWISAVDPTWSVRGRLAR